MTANSIDSYRLSISIMRRKTAVDIMMKINLWRAHIDLPSLGVIITPPPPLPL